MEDDDWVFHKDNSGKSDNSSEHITQHGFEEKKPYTAKDISEFIGKHANVATKTVWKAIEKTAEALGVKVNFINDAEYFKIHPKNSNGAYKNGEITIRSGIFGNPARAAYAMTHEAVHGVTSHIIYTVKKGDKKALARLSEKQIKAAQTLSKLLEYSKAKGHLKGEYGITNEHELLAELSNPDFVKKLQGTNKGVVDRIVNWVMDMIGIPQTDYDKARKILKDMLTAPKQVESNNKGVSLKETTIAKQQKDLGVQYSMLTKSDFNADGTVKESVLKEIEAEKKTIIEQAKANGTYMQAPNGKATNLNEEQWVATRTKRFKDWFGDWENDPENSSKVVDDNGEPLAVYHGTAYGLSLDIKSPTHFTEFKENKNGIHFGTEEQASTRMFYQQGQIVSGQIRQKVYSAFLNIKNPEKLRDAGIYWQGYISASKNLGYDGIVYENNHEGKGISYIVFNPNQIKSATDNVGAFSSDSNNILFQQDNNTPNNGKTFTKEAFNAFAQAWTKAMGVAGKVVTDAKTLTKVLGKDSAKFMAKANKLQKQYNFLFESKAVVNLTGKEFSQQAGKPLRTQVLDFFNSFGNKVKSVFGEVLLDQKAIITDLEHGNYREKAAAFKAIPEILKNGVEIKEWGQHHKGETTESGMIAAPIVIDGKEYIGVVTVRGSKNRMYVHDVYLKEKVLADSRNSGNSNPTTATSANTDSSNQGKSSPAINKDAAKVLKDIVTAKNNPLQLMARAEDSRIQLLRDTEYIETTETKEEDGETYRLAYKPVFENNWYYADNTNPYTETFGTIDEALKDLREAGDYDDVSDYYEPYKETRLALQEVWLDKDGSEYEEGDIIVYEDFSYQYKGHPFVQEYGQYDEPLGIEYHEKPEESASDLEQDVYWNIGREIEREVKVDGKTYIIKHSGRDKYSKIYVEDKNGNDKGTIQLRISDHTYNPSRNEYGSNFISVEISNRDKGRYANGRYQLKFDGDNTFEEVANAVNDRIEEIIEGWDIDFLRTADGTIFGATYINPETRQREYYVNQEHLNPETLIHETYHPFDSMMSEAAISGDAHAKAAITALDKLAKEHGYLERVQNNKSYADKTLAEQQAEARTQMVGEVGNAQLEKSFYDKLKTAVSDAIQWIANKFGVSLKGYTHEQILNLKLNDLVKASLGSMRKREFDGKDSGDTRKQIIGEQGAKNIPKIKANLEVARQMETAGKTPKEIWFATGWERTKDNGKWKYDLPDVELNTEIVTYKNGKLVKLPLKEAVGDGSKYRLSKIAHNLTDLTKAYPKIGDIIIEFSDKQPKGTAYYQPLQKDGFGRVYANEKIGVSTADLDNIKKLNSILIHEIQHAIQDIEGFARGGNPKRFTDKTIDTNAELIDKIKDVASSLFEELPNELKGIARAINRGENVEENYNKLSKNKEAKVIWANYINAHNQIKELQSKPKELIRESAYDQYLKLAGEVEARNAEKRLTMTEQERKEQMLSETEDVAEESKIYLYRDNGKNGTLKDDNVGTFSSDNNNILFQKERTQEATTAPLTAKEKTNFISRLFGKGLAKSITVDEAKMKADMEQRFGKDFTAAYEKNASIASQVAKASQFIKDVLDGKIKNGKASIEIPESANRAAEKVLGHKINSHRIKAEEIRHINNNHGINGKKNTDKSIPLTIEDIALAPYIMGSPDRVVKGNPTKTGAESVRYYKNLDNGRVVVVEREVVPESNNMENVTMWAEKSRSTNATSENQKGSSVTTSETHISQSDRTKILKDFENATNPLRMMSDGYDYRMRHTAPTGKDDVSVSIDRLDEIYPKDVYSEMGWHYYGDGDMAIDKKSHSILQSFKGNPDKMVSVYRAVPKGVKDINSGDWVTINRDYAVVHGESNLDGEYDIISKTLPANKVFTDANSLSEQGVQFLRTSQGEVKGYVTPDGHVFIDPKFVDSNTPVHEFGHLWNSHIKENNPELWEKGRELVKDSPEWDRIKNSKEYAHLKGDENKIADEVLATLYGKEGQKRLAGKDKGLLQDIKDWVAEVWNDIKQVFGKGNPDILKMTPEQISNLTLGEFIGKAVDNITDGKRVESSGKQETDSDFFAEDDVHYQIDSDQDNDYRLPELKDGERYKAVETRAFLSNNLNNDVPQMLEDNGWKYKQQNQEEAEASALGFLLLVGVSTNRKEKNSWSLKTQPFSKNINTIETFSIKNKDIFVPLYCSPFLK